MARSAGSYAAWQHPPYSIGHAKGVCPPHGSAGMPRPLGLEASFGRLRCHQRRISGRALTRKWRETLGKYREHRRRLAEAPRQLLHRLYRDQGARYARCSIATLFTEPSPQPAGRHRTVITSQSGGRRCRWGWCRRRESKPGDVGWCGVDHATFLALLIHVGKVRLAPSFRPRIGRNKVRA